MSDNPQRDELILRLARLFNWGFLGELALNPPWTENLRSGVLNATGSYHPTEHANINDIVTAMTVAAMEKGVILPQAPVPARPTLNNPAGAGWRPVPPRDNTGAVTPPTQAMPDNDLYAPLLLRGVTINRTMVHDTRTERTATYAAMIRNQSIINGMLDSAAGMISAGTPNDEMVSELREDIRMHLHENMQDNVDVLIETGEPTIVSDEYVDTRYAVSVAMPHLLNTAAQEIINRALMRISLINNTVPVAPVPAPAPTVERPVSVRTPDPERFTLSQWGTSEADTIEGVPYISLYLPGFTPWGLSLSVITPDGPRTLPYTFNVVQQRHILMSTMDEVTESDNTDDPYEDYEGVLYLIKSKMMQRVNETGAAWVRQGYGEDYTYSVRTYDEQFMHAIDTWARATGFLRWLHDERSIGRYGDGGWISVTDDMTLEMLSNTNPTVFVFDGASVHYKIGEASFSQKFIITRKTFLGIQRLLRSRRHYTPRAEGGDIEMMNDLIEIVHLGFVDLPSYFLAYPELIPAPPPHDDDTIDNHFRFNPDEFVEDISALAEMMWEYMENRTEIISPETLGQGIFRPIGNHPPAVVNIIENRESPVELRILSSEGTGSPPPPNVEGDEDEDEEESDEDRDENTW